MIAMGRASPSEAAQTSDSRRRVRRRDSRRREHRGWHTARQRSALRLATLSTVVAHEVVSAAAQVAEDPGVVEPHQVVELHGHADQQQQQQGGERQDEHVVAQAPRASGPSLQHHVHGQRIARRAQREDERVERGDQHWPRGEFPRPGERPGSAQGQGRASGTAGCWSPSRSRGLRSLPLTAERLGQLPGRKCLLSGNPQNGRTRPPKCVPEQRPVTSVSLWAAFTFLRSVVPREARAGCRVIGMGCTRSHHLLAV